MEIEERKEHSQLVSCGDLSYSYHTMSDSSFFSTRHLTEQDRAFRTSSHLYSLLNIFKGYIGISFLALPKGFSQVGLFGAVLEIVAILLLNLYSIQLLIKSRNKYKHHQIKNLCDLSEKVYGTKYARRMTDLLLVVTELSFCIAYTIYFGEQLDQIFC